MKFAGLISGGKDSIYAIQTLIDQGHTLVCVGNVAPDTKFKEMDSYMYQSAGNEIVSLCAQCLDVPFYQVVTKGLTLNKELAYDTPSEESEIKNDEVEDMFRLMQKMKMAHPEIQAVSSGAIMSTYQKNRVENLCGRLGLKSLAPIWKHEPKSLIQKFEDGGVKAILIRVCSYGLKEKHLGKGVVELRTHLEHLHDKFDVHCCGEGGEYETFVLDCKAYKKRIVIEESRIKVDLDNGIQYVARLLVDKAKLLDKGE